MAIDGGLRKMLAVGTKLVATYKKEKHTATVEQGEDGKIRFRLADGREFRSPSAAGSAVMSGQACNGWRFWSIQSGEADQTEAHTVSATDTALTGEAESAISPTIITAISQPITPTVAPTITPPISSVARPHCKRCGKSFVGPAQLAHHAANAERLCNPA